MQQQSSAHAQHTPRPAIIKPGSNVWMLGCSQLVNSIIWAGLTDEEFWRFYDDWMEGNMAFGKLSIDETKDLHAHYATCDISTIGRITFEDSRLHCGPTMQGYLDKIDKNPTAIIFMLHGNEFGVETLVETVPPWDFSFGDERPAIKGRQFVPSNDAVEYLKMVSRPLLTTCLLIRQTYPNTPIYYVPAPPPIESEEHILKNPEGFGELFRAYGLRPFEHRMKVFDVMFKFIAAQMTAMRVETIHHPQEALTPAGGLKTEYAAGCLHGNARYGKALIAQLTGE